MTPADARAILVKYASEMKECVEKDAILLATKHLIAQDLPELKHIPDRSQEVVYEVHRKVIG